MKLSRLFCVWHVAGTAFSDRTPFLRFIPSLGISITGFVCYESRKSLSLSAYSLQKRTDV